MTIRWKLNLTVMVLIAVFLAAGGFSMYAVSRTSSDTNEYAGMRNKSRFTADICTLVYAQVAAAGAPDHVPDGTVQPGWSETAAEVIDVQIRLAETERERQLWAGVRKSILGLESALREGAPDAKVRTLVRAADRDLRELRNHYEVEQYDSEAAAGRTSYLARVAIGIACLLTVLLFLVYLIMIRTWLMRPVEVLKHSTDTIGMGNLDHRVPLEGADELSELARRIDGMAASLAAHQAALVKAREFSAIGEMCANVAHGLRNPLAALRARAQLAALRADGSESVRASFNELAVQADLMEERIRQLFRFSQPMAVRASSARFRDLAQAARAQAQPILAEKNVSLEIDDRTGDTEWRLDREQMAEALAELITNAAHHSSPGAGITLRGGVEPPYNGTGPRLSVEVSDRGAGMPEATCRKAFDLFFTSRSGGTGIGLPLVQRIVEKHGGHIRLTSAVGEGTTARLVVQSVPPAGSAEPGSAQPIS